ncbi:MAG: AAA family ATPase [Blastocatellia bacterium]|nr:AAA family ATPase [Blastocatellia bacterium]
MIVTVPIYIEKSSSKGTPASSYTIRPLFFQEPVARDEDLNRAVNKLAKELKRKFDRLGMETRQDELAAYTFSPDIEDHFLKLTLNIAGRVARCQFLVVIFKDLDRKLAFTPSVPDLWFDIEKGESLGDRAAETLARYFRDKEKKEGQNAPSPEALSVDGKAWSSALDLDMHPPAMASMPKTNLFASLSGGEVLDGEVELETVGRCLDYLYPNDLSRVICRDREIRELTKLLTASDKRPVLLTGPRLVGKTALIHEFVYRSVSKKKSPYSSKKNVWLLSPQRLISGMSYVGQWENRLLAILEEAKKRNHILYFDDLLGLFHAGISSDSNLSVAGVLKPYIEKRQFRMLGEITPEALRILQERDRGFADLFHLLPVKEPDEDETFRILISLMRQLEQKHHCHFGIEVLPVVLDIERRYVRDAAFPGKAALFLQQLAVKYRNMGVLREGVLEEFHAKSGVALSFLNDRAKLEREEVVSAIGREVMGQPGAIEAVVDAVCIAKARLNDTTRPMQAFLFLGPTGVGKTQCAKSLANYLFGDAGKILRFDMNEYSSAYSVARLVGTFDQPEGLLTSSVRRQPFSVILLDEIEKAHPDVFNLLLQVMGDGRLTDALGRTADFTNAILIMTSNLGVREAGSNLGFRQDESKEASVYTQAAEKFFKPEFFNRLDRVVPFARLGREDIGKIARLLIQNLFARDGLARRKCVLRVDERAMEKIIDQGYHPQLGARALKRALEQQIAQPVASRLVAIRTDAPTIVSIYPGRDALAVSVEGLAGIEADSSSLRALELFRPKEIIERIEDMVSRVEDESSHLRPAGLIAPEEVRPEEYRYFLIQEQARKVRALCRRTLERLDGQRSDFIPRAKGRSLAAGQLTMRQADITDFWKEIVAAQSVHSYLRDLATASPPYGERVEDYLADALREASLLNAIAQGDQSSASRAIVYISSLEESGREERAMLIRLYTKLFGNQLGLEVALPDDCKEALGATDEAIVVTGAQAPALAKGEAGTHLFYPAQDSFAPIRVEVLPVADEEDVRSVIERNSGQWSVVSGRSDSSLTDVGLSPSQSLPVIRVYDKEGRTLDLRSGLLTLKTPTAPELRAFLLAGLPLPQEFEDDYD